MHLPVDPRRSGGYHSLWNGRHSLTLESFLVMRAFSCVCVFISAMAFCLGVPHRGAMWNASEEEETCDAVSLTVIWIVGLLMEVGLGEGLAMAIPMATGTGGKT